MSVNLSIIIPVYNEQDIITETLSVVAGYLDSYVGPREWEIVVVNDGSDDGTPVIVQQISQKQSAIRLVDLKVRCGRGFALKQGLDAAKGKSIVTLDADLSYAPEHIGRMLTVLHEQRADIVLASAYVSGGTVKNVPFKRYFLSWLGNRVLSFMFGGGVRVLTCLVRAYRADFIKSLDLNSNDKEIHLEILYKARMVGAKIIEVPADLCWKKHKIEKGQKKIKRRKTLAIKKTSASHLFFALMNRPGLIFWIPGYFLFCISFVIFCIAIIVVFQELPNYPSLYLTLRFSMLHAAPSWITMAVTFVLGVQFFTLGFLTAQSKKNYEESYKTLHAIYNKLNKG